MKGKRHLQKHVEQHPVVEETVAETQFIPVDPLEAMVQVAKTLGRIKAIELRTRTGYSETFNRIEIDTSP
jgi:hypothetical protein